MYKSQFSKQFPILPGEFSPINCACTYIENIRARRYRHYIIIYIYRERNLLNRDQKLGREGVGRRWICCGRSRCNWCNSSFPSNQLTARSRISATLASFNLKMWAPFSTSIFVLFFGVLFCYLSSFLLCWSFFIRIFMHWNPNVDFLSVFALISVVMIIIIIIALCFSFSIVILFRLIIVLVLILQEFVLYPRVFVRLL